jgi:hypothetical protein
MPDEGLGIAASGRASRTRVLARGPMRLRLSLLWQERFAARAMMHLQSSSASTLDRRRDLLN